jgi:hypothetical protein
VYRGSPVSLILCKLSVVIAGAAFALGAGATAIAQPESTLVSLPESQLTVVIKSHRARHRQKLALAKSDDAASGPSSVNAPLKGPRARRRPEQELTVLEQSVQDTLNGNEFDVTGGGSVAEGTWSGNGASGSAHFGGPPYCDYDLEMQVMSFSFRTGDGGKVDDASLIAIMDETANRGCPYPLGYRQPRRFELVDSELDGANLTLNFQGVDGELPKASATYRGRMEGQEIHGDLTFDSIDRAPPFDWRIETAEQLSASTENSLPEVLTWLSARSADHWRLDFDARNADRRETIIKDRGALRSPGDCRLEVSRSVTIGIADDPDAVLRLSDLDEVLLDRLGRPSIRVIEHRPRRRVIHGPPATYRVRVESPASREAIHRRSTIAYAGQTVRENAVASSLEVPFANRDTAIRAANGLRQAAVACSSRASGY